MYIADKWTEWTGQLCRTSIANGGRHLEHMRLALLALPQLVDIIGILVMNLVPTLPQLVPVVGTPDMSCGNVALSRFGMLQKVIMSLTMT